MKKKIFIDGSAGTTGLDIFRRISGRNDIELITLPEEKRKDTNGENCVFPIYSISSFFLFYQTASKNTSKTPFYNFYEKKQKKACILK